MKQATRCRAPVSESESGTSGPRRLRSPEFARLALRRKAMAPLLLGLLALVQPQARANDPSAEWIATVQGQWEDAGNWLCFDSGGNPTGSCVPGAGFDVSLLGGADVLLSTNPTVVDVIGDSSTSLTLGTGVSLTATGAIGGPSGVNVGILQVLGPGSAVTAATIGATFALGAAYSTLTATDGISAGTGTIVDHSHLSSLVVTGAWTISGSQVDNLAPPQSFSRLSAVQGASDILASSVIGSLIVDNGGSLLIDQGSTVSTPTSVTPTSIMVGAGALTVKGGSTVNANLAAVQMGSATGTGSFVLDGAGTTLQLNGVDITLGGISDSTLTVQNGAAIKSSGNTTLLVGAYSALGYFSGNTHVNVLGGGTVDVTDLLVPGNPTGATASAVLLSDPGSALTASDVWRLTGGTVDVENQAQGSAANMIDLQSGVITVGTGGSLSSGGPLLMGFHGTATLNVRSGGQLSSGEGVISQDAASTGVATVSGANSSWSSFGNLTVAYLGHGTLNVGAGGVVTSTADDIVGDQAGAVGEATVSDPGSAWHVGGALTIAHQQGSQGTLTAMAQGVVTTGGSATIGDGLATQGQASFASGARWTVGNLLTVGNQGTGQLSIGGINTEVDDLGATIAAQSTGNGAVSVTIGGKWNTTNSLTIAGEGNGQLGVDLGALVTVGGGVNLAAAGGSIGSLTVDGTMGVGGDLSVGAGGSGQMTVENGASLSSAGGHVGVAPGAVGTATVTGFSAVGGVPASWAIAGPLTVGEGGTGTLTVSATAQVASQRGSIGEQANAVGTVTVGDPGSKWTMTGPLTVGTAGSGTLSIVDGGQVQSLGGQVGGIAGSNGVVEVTGAGSKWSGGAGTITVGGLGGPALLKVTDGGQVAAGTVVVAPGGRMGGDGGSIVASVVNTGGVVRPGDATGVLRITGDYTQNSGTLLFELDGTGAGQFDQLLVSGGATFSGGQIEVSFGGGYMPLVGDAFALIQAGSLSNGGVGLNVVGLGSGLAFSEAFSPGGLVLTFTSAVPEPAQWASLTVGLALLMCLRRAKSARPRD